MEELILQEIARIERAAMLLLKTEKVENVNQLSLKSQISFYLAAKQIKELQLLLKKINKTEKDFLEITEKNLI